MIVLLSFFVPNFCGHPVQRTFDQRIPDTFTRLAHIDGRLATIMTDRAGAKVQQGSWSSARSPFRDMEIGPASITISSCRMTERATRPSQYANATYCSARQKLPLVTPPTMDESLSYATIKRSAENYSGHILTSGQVRSVRLLEKNRVGLKRLTGNILICTGFLLRDKAEAIFSVLNKVLCFQIYYLFSSIYENASA